MYIFECITKPNPMYLQSMGHRKTDPWLIWTFDKNKALRISTETRAWEYYKKLKERSKFKDTITFYKVPPRTVECFHIADYDRAMGII